MHFHYIVILVRPHEGQMMIILVIMLKKVVHRKDQHSNVFVENSPYLGSVFTVGGTTPKPTFPNLLKAAEWLAFKGTNTTEVTLLVKENTSLPAKIYDYQSPITFTQIYTPACMLGDATLVIKPLTTLNSVNLTYPDANVYMTFDGIPAVTFKDLKITGETPENPFMLSAKNGTNLKLENVTITGGITMLSSGSNVFNGTYKYNT